ncbi:hypothetical protein Hanom_Chr09g00788901 [Helianthus anomalus]
MKVYGLSDSIYRSSYGVTSVLFATPSGIINLEQTHADVVVSISARLFGFLRMLLCLLVSTSLAFEDETGQTIKKKKLHMEQVECV